PAIPEVSLIGYLAELPCVFDTSPEDTSLDLSGQHWPGAIGTPRRPIHLALHRLRVALNKGDFIPVAMHAGKLDLLLHRFVENSFGLFESIEGQVITAHTLANKC